MPKTKPKRATTKAHDNLAMSDTIEQWPIGKLVPYERNAREHSPEQVDTLAALIAQTGFRNPILVNPKTCSIIAGHGRLMAAKKLGLTRVPVIPCKGLTVAQEMALRIADNRLAEQATWNEELLATELERIQEAGFELEAIGFSEDELRALEGLSPEEAEAKEPVQPDPPRAPAISRVGDVWIMGGQRVACGDSSSEAVWDALMRGMPAADAALVFTDPPYGVSLLNERLGKIKNDALRDDALSKMLEGSLRLLVKHSQDDAAYYIWHASSTRQEFDFAMRAVGLVEIQQIVWVKPTPVLGHAHYHWAHELCYYAAKGGHTPPFHGDRANATVWRASVRQANKRSMALGNGVIVLDGNGGGIFLSPKVDQGKRVRRVSLGDGEAVEVARDTAGGTVWEIKRDHGAIHPSQKPVALAMRAIINSTLPDELVLDAFAGSGSTMLAAEELGRRSCSVELDGRYVDQIVRRWEELTGKKAQLAGSGQSLEEVQRERRAQKRRKSRRTE